MPDADKVKITCAHCKSSFLVPGPAEGKKFRCPKCREVFGVAAESKATTQTHRQANAPARAPAKGTALVGERKSTAREMLQEKQRKAREAHAARMKKVLPVVIGLAFVGLSAVGWMFYRDWKSEADREEAAKRRQEANKKMERMLIDARKYIESSAYKEAIATLDPALDPAHPFESSLRWEAEVVRGRAKVGLRDFAGAIADIDEGLKDCKEEGGSWEAYYYRGAALLAGRRDAEAVESLSKSTRAHEAPGDALKFSSALSALVAVKGKVIDALEKYPTLVPACGEGHPALDVGAFDVSLAPDHWDKPGWRLAGDLDAKPIVDAYKPDDFPIALVALREDTPVGAAFPGLKALADKGLTRIAIAAQAGGKLHAVPVALSKEDPGDTKVSVGGLARPSELVSAIEAKPAGKATLWLDPSAQNDGALAAALLWLARHQEADGSWSPDGFNSHCEGDACQGTGSAVNAPGVTALAALAFLSAGIAPSDAHWPGFGKAVESALGWLAKQQQPDGSLLPPGPSNKRVFQHVFGTLALTQASRMPGGEKWKEPAQKAVAWLEKSIGAKAWGYEEGDATGDTCVTGWATVAIAIARAAGLTASDATLAKALAWTQECTDDREFQVRYHAKGGERRYGKAQLPVMAAHALMVRLLVAGDAQTPRTRGYGSLLAKALPQGGDTATWDYYYWHVATHAIWLLDGPGAGGEVGPYWKAWSKAVGTALAPIQTTGGECSAGSWRAEDPWSSHGGRVYATAINAMTLSLVTGRDGLYKGLKQGK